ncbi:MAG: TerD family protein [Jatrophihabitans sp.]
MSFAGLPVEMVKGANLGLRELDAELGSVTVVLETTEGDEGDVDPDVSVLLLATDGRVRTNDDLVFYNQRVALDGAIHLRDKVRTEIDDRQVLLDTVTVNLDDVPNDVERIVLVASLDSSLEMSFGAAAHMRMQVQRSSDAQDLVSFTISDAADETALLVGEFYRRAGQWRIRAIGQGYRGGLADLATDFGVEIDLTSAESEAESAPSEGGAPESASEVVSEVPAEVPDIGQPDGKDLPGLRRLSVRRPTRAPKMPAAWNRSIPTDDGDDWKRARLFPVAGIGGAEEQEQRATSALLAVASIVREFGRLLVNAMGGPVGLIETYTEVRFGQDERTVRPDGVLCSTWGQRTWTALVEVKTAGKLALPQIDSYVEVARAKSYDAVIMISNELTMGPDEYPVDIDRRKLKKVTLRHIGWDEICAMVTLCLDHRGVADTTQRRVLAEFLRYMDHPRSGVQGFTDMGQHWVRVRDSAKNKTLRPGDRGAVEVIDHFDQLVRHIGLGLSGMLGADVQTLQPAGMDGASRCQQFSDSGVLFASLRVPGAVDAMVVGMDVRTDRVSCSVNLPAPREGRRTTRVNWLLRQLEAAHDTLRVEALLVGARAGSTADSLRAMRADPQVIIPKDNRDIRAFRLTLDLPIGTKRETGRGSVVGSIESVVYRFYAEVLQHLQRPTSTRPPRMPAPPPAS